MNWDPAIVSSVHQLPEGDAFARLADEASVSLPQTARKTLHEWRGKDDSLRLHQATYIGVRLQKLGVHHLHVHFAGMAARTAFWIKRFFGIEYSLTVHANDIFVPNKFEIGLPQIFSTARAIVAVSDFAANQLRHRFPDSGSRVHRVYNGIDLARFPARHDETTRLAGPSRTGLAPYHVPRIISVGRLVAFKGFEHLIDACAELARRGFDFVCDIIGDGPLRDTLQTKIDILNLSSRVYLSGSLSQQAVLEKLQAVDIFVLASVTDAQGASDVFPTVILEAMASARPVVSTRLAGISELVEDRQTGVLVSPGDTSALTQALEQLLRDGELRLRYGRAGRDRIEQHFRIEDTVVPLLKLFERASVAVAKLDSRRASHSKAATGIAYLIDQWPDEGLPLLQRELQELKRASRSRGIPIVPVVCELNSGTRLDHAMEKIAPSLEFLPDAMVLEAEWRANPTLGQKLEEERAQQNTRAPSGIFLRQARFALVLRRLLREKKVSHVHATSSRALVCALILKKLLDVTVSVTIEARPELARDWIENALPQCVGGRMTDRKLLDQCGRSFLVDKTTFRSASRKTLGLISQKTRIDLTAGQPFWQQWAELLFRWSDSNRKSTIENPK